MSFKPFSDFTASSSELEELQQLRDEDRLRNLERRHLFFLRQNPEVAQAKLGFVPLIGGNLATVIGVPGEGEKPDLAYTVGWWYFFQTPEVMLIGEGKGQQMADALSRVTPRLLELSRDLTLPETYAPITAMVREELAAAGLEAGEVGTPTADFLKTHPFGYGSYFYAHFLDDHRAPLLSAEVK